ncbi:MAG: aminotransferase class I/II-fold pyridoxal phosphate-dependent enzyme [Myxococcales bacterium]|nr:aminotransferase class I/II-fold pyridoxal phosphate-dependent enzyme [Myxococcales bacterium]
MTEGPAVNLNIRVRGLRQSATIAINDRSNALIAAGRSVYKLGLGQSPFPVPREVVDALRDNAERKDYLPVAGLPELRAAVADFHRRVDHVDVAAENVLVGPGSKELMFLLQLAYYGDLLVPAPCWVSYAPQARIIGRPVTFIPTRYEERWRLKPERLEEICADDPGRPRLLILNYPGNPDGSTYSATELQQLAEVAKRYKVVLLSDEIYGPLYHDEDEGHVSIAKYYPTGTIISSGLSKWCGAGGWRLGTFAFPPALRWLFKAMASAASETFTSTSAPIQCAAVTAFAGSDAIDAYLARSRRILAALGQWCCNALRRAGARIWEPRGAFYLLPDFSPMREHLEARDIRDDRELCRRALEETGVAFLPGADFGMWPQQLTARLAYVDFDGAAALDALEAGGDAPVDEEFLRAYCPKVIDGIEALCSWLKGK